MSRCHCARCLARRGDKRYADALTRGELLSMPPGAPLRDAAEKIWGMTVEEYFARVDALAPTINEVR